MPRAPNKPASPAKPKRPRRPLPVVGVGASAGGLDAMQRLIAAVPARTRLAIVYVQHLDPERENLLVPLLAARTALKVVAATDGIRLTAGHVYVAPPHTDVSLAAGRLRLAPQPNHPAPARTIDTWFAALAADRGPGAIAVVLSGSGDDGARGAVAVRQAGGVVLAQEPGSARFDSMPARAIASGAVEVALAPEQLGKELVRLAVAPRPRHRARAPAAAHGGDAGDDPMAAIFDLLRSSAGIDFGGYKRPMVQRRIVRRMALRDIADLDSYAALLRDDAGALAELRQDLLIRVTGFFRDPAVFRALEQDVLPALVERGDPTAPFRVWVPGCATGEEAYSIAMCVLDVLGDRRPLQLFATDIQQEGIEQARRGVYPARALKRVTAARRARYFRSNDDGDLVVHRRLRDACVFARHDLTRDPPFSRLDLVSCRNLLIYLQPPLQRKVVRLLHYALAPRGCLVLGAAESTGATPLFTPHGDKRRKIYLRCDNKTTRELGQPLLAGAPADHGTLRASSAPPAPARPGATDLPQEADRIILARYAPPSVLVDERLDILQFRGDTSAYLEHRPGSANLALLRLVRQELALELRAVLRQARTLGEPYRAGPVGWQRPDGGRETAIEAVPIRLAADQGSGFLVLFHDTPVAPAAPQAPHRTRATDHGAAAEQRVAELDLELDAARSQLRAAIEEHEAMHEELRAAMEEVTSTNEELQSINEELETAKEELQSANEELQSINDELQLRNADLGQVNVDLQNLLSSMDVPIFMLGKALTIRRFNGSVERLFHVIASDVGRPILDLRSNLDLTDLEQVLGAVVEGGAPVQREVRDTSGHVYSMWARPYLTAEGARDGVVLAFFDVTDAKRDQEALQLFAERLHLLGEIDSAVLAGHDLAAVARLALPRIRQFLGAAHAGVHVLNQDSSEAATLVEDPDQDAAVTHNLFEDDGGTLPLTTTDDLCIPDLALVRDRGGTLARLFDQGMRSLVSVPLVVKGRLTGRLFATARTTNAFDGGHTALARDVAEHLAVAIEQARLYEQVRAARARLAGLASHLVAAQEAERRRVAKELHDEIGQVLTGLKLSLVAVATSAQAAEIADAIRQVDRLIATVRALSLDLRPAVLDDLGLLPALLTHNENLTMRTGLQVRMEHQGVERRFPSEVETAAYRIVQEALTNVVRHAGVQQATVRLWGDAEGLTIQVTDQGAGFTPEVAVLASNGLSGMIERAAALGGELTLDAAPGQGTRVLATLPLAGIHTAERASP